MTEASGTVTANTENGITESTYRVSYTYGPAQYSIKVTSKVISLTSEEIEVPDAKDYKQIDDISPVLTIEKASAYIQASENMSVQQRDDYICQASGQYVQLNVDYQGSTKDGTYVYAGTTDVVRLDLSTQKSSQSIVDESYDGTTYSATLDGEVVESYEVSPSEIKSELLSLPLSPIPKAQMINSITVNDLGDFLLLEITPDTRYGQGLCSFIGAQLYDNPEVLHEISSDCKCNALSMTMGINKYTGLPTGATFAYVGSHNIEGYDYSLAGNIYRNYTLGDPTVHEKITEERPDYDKNATPTPAFYKVTNADGGTAWILTESVVLDQACGNLPQQVWDAIDAADYLCLTDDEYANAGNIPSEKETLSVYASNMVYADGTQLTDHIDLKTFEKAYDLLTVAGLNYSDVMAYKPILVMTMVADFLERQSYALSDSFSLNRAISEHVGDTEKEIRVCVNELDYMNAIFGFSEKTQIFLLNKTIDDNTIQVRDSYAKKYEFWFNGDEAAWSEYIANDMTGDTQAEIAAYTEYLGSAVTFSDSYFADIEDCIGGGKSGFYLVDAKTLYAEGCLMDQLKDAGYTVEKVSFE